MTLSILIKSNGAIANMSKINLANVVVKDNPAPFGHPFQFEITFECIEHLGDGKYVNDFQFYHLFVPFGDFYEFQFKVLKWTN